jgi:hypothetical protein
LTASSTWLKVRIWSAGWANGDRSSSSHFQTGLLPADQRQAPDLGGEDPGDGPSQAPRGADQSATIISRWPKISSATQEEARIADPTV